MSKILDRVADAGGFLYFVLIAVGYIVLASPYLPEDLESPQAVVAHLEAHPPTTALWVGLWLEGAGLAALVLLAARIAGRIRAVQPAGWVPSAAVGLAVAAFTVKLASFGPGIAALHVDRYDAQTVTALLDLNDAAYDLSWAIDGAFAVLLGLGALAARALPGWLAGLAVAAGLAVLVGLAVPSTFDLLQFVFLVWLLVTSGWLLARGDRRPVHEPRESVAAAA
ncbi:hypothetical protein GCM10010531_42600 [Blastococcus jejuensis]|uniref:DUF4386 family protein n=1 Tax=Blastococcus jejuensis TaxID=351224 RepID=A0ABP6PNB9_9ACTN